MKYWEKFLLFSAFSLMLVHLILDYEKFRDIKEELRQLQTKTTVLEERQTAYEERTTWVLNNWNQMRETQVLILDRLDNQK